VDLAGLKRWLDEYGRAWEQGDESVVERLYTPDIKYYETPFSEPDVGYDAVVAYKRSAKAAQKDIHFWHEPLAAIDDTGIARWGCSFVRVPSGRSVDLDGVFVLRFDEHGRCRELREWWHRVETDGASGSKEG
jgi:hypothetical protein